MVKVKIDMVDLMGDALRATDAEKLSALHPEISIQVETKLRICLGKNSATEIGVDDKAQAMLGDAIYGGTGEQQEPADVRFSGPPVKKEENQ